MEKFQTAVILIGLFISSVSFANNKADNPATSSPDSSNTTTVSKIDTSVIRIPGLWVEFLYDKNSGQHFYKNDEGVIIAIAINPMKTYSFYTSSKSQSEIVVDFFKWEYDYRVSAGFKCNKISQNDTDHFILWKFTENGIDNVFLYGIRSELLTNYLVYTDKWNEQKKITFLEKLNTLNK